MEIVGWLDGLGGATLDQIRRRFGLGRTQGYRRVQVLQDFGLLRRLRPLVNMPALYVAGRRTVKPWAFEHGLLVGDLVVDLELDGRTVLGEVSIRRERLDGWSGVGTPTPAQLDAIKRCDRIPDLVELRPDGELVAYEVEIASKGRSRRERILTAYAFSDYVAVEWIAPERQLARLLRNDVREMRLDDLIRVTHGRRIELPTLADRAAQPTTEEVLT